MTDLKNRVPVCSHSLNDSISFDLINALDTLERFLGYQLTYNSGYRCPECNEKAGGAKDSAHLRGAAVDCDVANSHRRYDLLQAAVKIGIRRIGIGKTFIHLDVDTSLLQGVIWLY